jgi:hypothetical protein
MAPETQQLTNDERLVASIARATCFAFRVDPTNTDASDVDAYVDLLLGLLRTKPDAVVGSADATTVRDSVAFCAEQLRECAPAQAAALRDALKGRQHGAT